MASLLETGYNAIQSGGREDLSDLISNVDAKSTVFTSMAKKGKKPGNAVMGWQMDKYATAVATGTVDGSDVDMTSAGSFTNPAVDRVLAQNYVQIFRRVFRVSGLADEIQVVAGVKSELANGIAKKLVELKRDMELTFLNDGHARLDNGSVGYLTKSLGSFLHASGGSAPHAVNAKYYCTAIKSAATGSLAEEDVQDNLGQLFTATGTIRDYDMILGSTLKRVFTSFTQSATGSNDRLAIKTFNQEASAKSYINVVDVFEGDFGRLRLHPSNFVAKDGSAVAYRGYIVPFELAEIRYGKLPQIKELQDNGGGPARLVEAVAALVIYNPSAFGFYNATS